MKRDDDPTDAKAADAREEAAAARLRDALDESSGGPDGLADLARAVRSAAAPAELDAGDLDRLVAGALEAADVSADEAREAGVLRDALDANEAPFASAVRAAATPRDLPASVHDDLVRTAMTRLQPMPRRAARARIAFGGVVTAFALAAAVLLGLRASAPTQVSSLVHARSTQSLFDAPFTAEGTTARIDRIALARASDFRSNRFTSWGVR